MRPKDRSTLTSLSNALQRTQFLQREAEILPPDLSSLRDLIKAYLKTGQCLAEMIDDQIYHLNALACDTRSEADLTAAEIEKLLMLNRQLAKVRQHLKAVGEDVRPHMEKKLADPADPMIDYEIEVRIDYVLRGDDPDYAEDDDNYLTTRHESLKRMDNYLPDDENTDYAKSYIPEALRAEPHCWLFYDLYDHEHGIEGPRLSFRDCLRIGQIFIDVQVWQQYSFDVDKGEWNTHWGRDGN